MHKANSQCYTMSGPLQGGGASLTTLLSFLQVMQEDTVLQLSGLSLLLTGLWGGGQCLCVVYAPVSNTLPMDLCGPKPNHWLNQQDLC